MGTRKRHAQATTTAQNGSNQSKPPRKPKPIKEKTKTTNGCIYLILFLVGSLAVVGITYYTSHDVKIFIDESFIDIYSRFYATENIFEQNSESVKKADNKINDVPTQDVMAEESTINDVATQDVTAEESKIKTETKREKDDQINDPKLKTDELKMKMDTKKEKEEKKTTPEKIVYENEAITNEADHKIRNKLDIADKLVEKGKFDEAITSYDAMLRAHPNSPRAMHGKALALDKLANKRRSNQILEEAIQTFQTILTLPDVPKELLMKSGLLLAERQTFRGWSADASRTLQTLLHQYPDDVQLQNHLGVTYLMRGEEEKARQTFLTVLKLNPDSGFAKTHLAFIMQTVDGDSEGSIPLFIEGIASGEEGTDDGRFYSHLGDSLQRVGRAEEAYEYFRIGAERGFFPSAYQRSLYNVDNLAERPWWTTDQTGHAEDLKKLERHWQTIRDEGMALLNQTSGLFVSESEQLTDTGDWKQLTIFQQGRKNKKVCDKVPKTCALVAAIPDAVDCQRGQVKYSVMHPGVHVWPHCGPTNCRIRTHLGLVIPPGPRIRVGNVTRTWTEGKFIVFDDSFEHEVWHDGTALRLVLILDLWHPDLTEQQKRSLSPI